jgi:hypothetical protein
MSPTSTPSCFDVRKWWWSWWLAVVGALWVFSPLYSSTYQTNRRKDDDDVVRERKTEMVLGSSPYTEQPGVVKITDESEGNCVKKESCRVPGYATCNPWVSKGWCGKKKGIYGLQVVGYL